MGVDQRCSPELISNKLTAALFAEAHVDAFVIVSALARLPGMESSTDSLAAAEGPAPCVCDARPGGVVDSVVAQAATNRANVAPHAAVRQRLPIGAA